LRNNDLINFIFLLQIAALNFIKSMAQFFYEHRAAYLPLFAVIKANAHPKRFSLSQRRHFACG